MGMLKEFKEFAVKGNAFDLAVGVIIGAAFGKIVSSVVNDIIMPPIGMFFGGVNFTEIKIILKSAIIDSAGKITTPAVTLNIGNFIQTIIDFTIIAFAVFMFVKALNSMKKKEDAPPAGPTQQELLLTEIRDAIKEGKAK